LVESRNSDAKIRVMAIDDDRITLKFVMACLGKDPAYDVIAMDHGQKALEMIKGDPPDILVTDWMMPDLDGLELCRLVRNLDYKNYIYIILLTARTDHDDIIKGLEAGADDYMVKPFDQGELLARVRAGARVVAAQKALTEANEELQKALAQIKTLKGLLPICMDCKKVRDDKDYWQDIQDYLSQTTDTEFSHGLCPICMQKRMAELKAISDS
jgi:sigma-B regulation protein RsbU (phosphoserine phosphatase)